MTDFTPETRAQLEELQARLDVVPETLADRHHGDAIRAAMAPPRRDQMDEAATVSELRSYLREFDRIIREQRCGDSACMWGNSGMCTNGGCRCARQGGLELQRRLRLLALSLRSVGYEEPSANNTVGAE